MTDLSNGANTAFAFPLSVIDPYAIDVIIEDLAESKIYYITGDTLYSKEIFSDLPKGIDVVFLPINGVGNNMNEIDSVRFLHACGAKKAVPYHIGMFDEKTPCIFDDENKIIVSTRALRSLKNLRPRDTMLYSRAEMPKRFTQRKRNTMKNSPT